MRLCRSGKRQIYFLRCLDNSDVGFGALAIARDLIVVDPTCPAHRTGALESKKKPLPNSTKLQPEEKNYALSCYPHGLDSTIRIALVLFSFTTKTHINQDGI